MQALQGREMALEEKDSRLFAYRRVAKWEDEERAKCWEKSVEHNSTGNSITYFNNFDFYPAVIAVFLRKGEELLYYGPQRFVTLL
jgi:hypothetical protein